MIDVRNQIKEALLTITDNVRVSRPEGKQSFPLITYAEITNTQVGMFEERLTYQVDGHSETFEGIIELMRQIDDVMTGMGWHRTYITPDTQARQDKDFYKKSASYVARIDNRINNILGGF